jgi:glycosyltransferase involved in cell wall biosynthesis
MKFSHFKGVTLLITHYNRSRSLERLLLSFENLAISFEAIVVSDDCSKPEHQTYLQNLQLKHSFQLVKGPVNKGLGNNLNNSDHPHLRRSNFVQKFGKYREALKGDATEYGMMMSFLQKKGKGMFYNSFKSLLNQENSSLEPSTMKRNLWRESGNPLISKMRYVYRQLKFNVDYLFGKY